MKQFIVKQGASNYYLVDNGMGGAFNPPQDAEHNYSIAEFRGGHEVGGYSLSGAIDSQWMPQQVKFVAARTLKQHKGIITEDWIQSVYKYFAHCYSKDGQDRNVSNSVTFGKFWNNAEQEKDYPAEYHLAYLFVKKFDPTHTPRLDLMGRGEPSNEFEMVTFKQ